MTGITKAIGFVVAGGLILAIGMTLSAAPIAEKDRLRLDGKMKRVQTLAPQWVQAGGDPSKVAPLGPQIEEHLKAGRFDEAERLVDQILTTVTGPTDGGSSASGGSEQPTQLQRLDGKMKRVQTLAPQWVQAGGDQTKIAPLGPQIDEHLKAGRFDDAERLVDQILATVTGPTDGGGSASGGSQQPTQLQRLDGKMKRVQPLAHQWVMAGGDPAKVAPLGPQIDEHLKAGRFDEAERLVDQILATVTGPTAVASAKTGAMAIAAPPAKPIPGSFADKNAKPVEVRAIPSDAAILFWSTRSQSSRPDSPSLGPSELYVMDKDAQHVTQITFDVQSYEHAAVSFSRKLIAANRYLKKGAGEAGLWVLDLEKKTETRLLPDFYSAGNGGVDWSRDEHIYFSGKPTSSSQRDIFRIRPDGTDLAQLTFAGPTNPGEHFDVSVSEDGTMVAYVKMVPFSSGSKRGPKTQIWVMGSDGSNQRMVYDGGTEIGMAGGFPIGAYDPEISPDGRQVIFSFTNPAHNNFRSSLNMAHDLYIVNIDGTGLRRMTSPGPICVIPDWHDNKILYTEYNEKENFVGLVSMNVDGSGRKRLEPGLKKVWDGGMNGKFIPSP